MSLRRILIHNFSVDLVIAQGKRIHPMNYRFPVRIVLSFLLKEIRILPADHQEMTAQIPVTLLSGKLIKLHEADLDLLMTVKAIPALRP